MYIITTNSVNRRLNSSYPYFFFSNWSLGIVGNIWVLIVMMSSSTLRSKPINMFIINQSILDFGASVCILLRQFFHDLHDIPDIYILRSVWCSMWLSNLVHIFMFASSGYNLVALSFERYAAIMNPLAYDEEKVNI